MEFELDDLDGVGAEACARLEDMPLVILKQQVLLRLDARSICRLEATGSHYLKGCCRSDEVWQRLAEERGWALSDHGQGSWREVYLENRARLCAECNKFTKYIFSMTGDRLCDNCEQANPHKYALVTVCEATEAYGLSSVELLNLTGPLKRLGTSLYLRCEVKAASQAQARNRAPSDASDYDDDTEEEDGAGTSAQDRSQGGRSSGKIGKEEKKAARKANKKQVKQQQRERRLIGSSPPSQSRSLGASPHSSWALGSSPPGSHRKKATSSNSRRQPHVRHSHQVTEGPSMRSVSTCSPWVQERERLMTEYGEFGISGLALAAE